MEDIIKNVNSEELGEVAGGLDEAKTHAKIVNCKHCVNVRSTPSSDSDDNKIGYAYLGDSYVFYGWTGKWAKIQYGSRKAYVFKDFIKIV